MACLAQYPARDLSYQLFQSARCENFRDRAISLDRDKRPDQSGEGVFSLYNTEWQEWFLEINYRV